MNFVRGTLAALALSIPASAIAADLPPRLPVKAPVMAPVVYNWTGFYVGGNGGYSWGQDRTSIDGTVSTVLNSSVFRTASGPGAAGPVTTLGPVVLPMGGSATSRVDGPIAGGQIGYNWQTGAWVFGLETDLQWSGERGSITNLCLDIGCGVVANSETHLKWFGTFRGRAGFLIDPRVLLYATGGLVYGGVDTSYGINLLGVAGASSFSSVRVGWTAGAGIEGAIDNNWSIKAEYLYADYGRVSNALGAVVNSATIILPDTPDPAFSTILNAVVTANGAATSRFTDHVVRAGINYRFSAAPVVARY